MGKHSRFNAVPTLCLSYMELGSKGPLQPDIDPLEGKRGCMQALHFYQWNCSSTSRNPKCKSIQTVSPGPKVEGLVETSTTSGEVEVIPVEFLLPK